MRRFHGKGRGGPRVDRDASVTEGEDQPAHRSLTGHRHERAGEETQLSEAPSMDSITDDPAYSVG
jgi:hypothetical protein